MKTILILLLLTPILCEDLITQEGVDKIKAAGATWELDDPETTVFKNISIEEFASRLQSSWPDDSDLPELEIDFGQEDPNNSSRLLQSVRLPTNFDGRKEWGKCIHPGGDQKKCSGCWAFGVTNHLSDRFCIKGWDVVLSVQDLLECAPGNKCCEGGSAEKAYKHIMQTGVVDAGCKPFDTKCGECRPRSCARYRCVKNSAWVSKDAQKVKWEIYMNGPVTAIYNVYDDFAYYRGGIYRRTSQKKIGTHSVTLVGWGVSQGMEYWICKNSWGDKWGLNGFFMIKSGDAEINDYMTSCKPLIE